MVLTCCTDKNDFVVASDQIPVHMSQQNVANSIDNSYFSVNLVSAFWPKAETQTPEYRRHSLRPTDQMQDSKIGNINIPDSNSAIFP